MRSMTQEEGKGSVEKDRSTDPQDFQDLPQAIGAMSKRFASGFVIPLHHHARDQLLYAAAGIMHLRAEREAWMVPRGSAVYIPAGTRHSVAMHGEVDMRTLYIDAEAATARPSGLGVIAVSSLLHALILALSEEPIIYGPGSRGDLLAKLIDVEIARARALSLNVALPSDRRLQRLCAELLANPSDRRTLDAWSEVAGASPRTLARLFKQDLGMSFHHWRQRIRFHHALEALSQGTPIARVAEAHGYKSPSAFSAAFAKVMGRPPSKLLNEHER